MFTASIFPGPAGTIDTDLATATLKLEAELGQPVWLLVQKTDTDHPFGDLDEPVRLGFFMQRKELRNSQRSALLIDSSGGLARPAYQISTLFRRHCDSFTAIVPRYAKSAATLLVLGANPIIMGRDAELGPLDVQIFDPDTEHLGSALDEVQALERLNSAALDQVDQAMLLMLGRTHKKIDTLMPVVMSFVAEMMRPLMEKIDTVHYSQRARVLKVAEEYATRLLGSRFSPQAAARISRRLVNGYPEHGFVIDAHELARPEYEGFLGAPPSEALLDLLDTLEEYLTLNDEIIAIGRVVPKEANNETEKADNVAISATDGEIVGV